MKNVVGGIQTVDRRLDSTDRTSEPTPLLSREMCGFTVDFHPVVAGSFHSKINHARGY